MLTTCLATLTLRLTRLTPYLSPTHKLFIKRVFHRSIPAKKTHHIHIYNPASFQPRTFQIDHQENMAASDEFRLVLPGIDHEGKLPRKYTAEGQGARKNISPPVEWYNLPPGTKSLALVVEIIDAPDPNDPVVPFTNWVVVNIPPSVKSLPEDFSGKEEDQMGGQYGGLKEGNNDLKVPGWCGPKMPSPGHRFEFKLYALDDELNLGHKVTKEKVLETIEGHVLGESVVTAYF